MDHKKNQFSPYEKQKDSSTGLEGLGNTTPRESKRSLFSNASSELRLKIKVTSAKAHDIHRASR